ncbi:unnamed protein product [Arabidopsis lyrata]|uniref:Uncharacterized protein n=1 Tax=Arabidopsis lyrata subsp. lyrata TaxID=81972 RepID=D7MAX0_ARALL|nr:hypothetical protein ARALYDRAFT_915304 [Arabidopsis lyrata subsp. lyrata]CAH8276595.1 unnamed protein product [Arabidopsis lyrata]
MGKQRISEGKKESKVLEDEISYLVEKLNELKSPKVKDMEARNFRHNIDNQSQKHCQQAIGFSSTNPNIRCDTLSQQLFYPRSHFSRHWRRSVLKKK